MTIVQPDSSWNDYPTKEQLFYIREAAHRLNLDIREEDYPRNRLEVRSMVYSLYNQVKAKNKERGKKVVIPKGNQNRLYRGPTRPRVTERESRIKK